VSLGRNVIWLARQPNHIPTQAHGPQGMEVTNGAPDRGTIVGDDHL